MPQLTRLAIAFPVAAALAWLQVSHAMVKVVPLPTGAILSGTVESTVPFKAAQVFIRNVDKRVLYMVFTRAG